MAANIEENVIILSDNIKIPLIISKDENQYIFFKVVLICELLECNDNIELNDEEFILSYEQIEERYDINEVFYKIIDNDKEITKKEQFDTKYFTEKGLCMFLTKLRKKKAMRFRNQIFKAVQALKNNKHLSKFQKETTTMIDDINKLILSNNELKLSNKKLKLSYNKLKLSYNELKLSYNELKLINDELKLINDELILINDELKNSGNFIHNFNAFFKNIYNKIKNFKLFNNRSE